MLDYHEGMLHWDGVSIKKIAEEFGTPFFLYNWDVIENDVKEIKKAFNKKSGLICYACKSNANLYLMKRIAQLGLGLDIVSAGELYLGMTAGFDPGKTVFAGVGKTETEIEQAIKYNILSFNVESEEEFNLIIKKSKVLKIPARVSIRINPDVDPTTHPHISTGMGINKFGISLESAKKLLIRAHEEESIKLMGIHTHIGSQVSSREAVRNTAQLLKDICNFLGERNIAVKYVNMGGGLPVSYEEKTESSFSPAEWAEIIYNELEAIDSKLIVEPGRRVMARGGILITKVLYRKKTPLKDFIIVDSGNNDFIRPTLYGASHRVVPVNGEQKEKIVSDIVGPICESSDFFAKDIKIQDVKSGELLAILDTGAYGFTLSSNYNSRLKLPEILIENGDVRLIRKRETFKSLLLNQVY